ncbi:hypothetical protein L6452_13976 [Arctium lappa]|uniref:Uncharacterized protein n=1 Tax=Arctium lappa TaxID=4217 RepID=A0ACB9CJS1_ARCLA|nr:hypothetical protein L6452_13976 [Arctium lappa]
MYTDFLTLLHKPFLFIFITDSLLNLKQRWGNPSSITNWNASLSPCKWSGIFCNVNGSMIMLDIPSKGLTGSISSFIYDLRNLENLLLYDNFLTIEFPRVLYNWLCLVEIVVETDFKSIFNLFMIRFQIHFHVDFRGCNGGGWLHILDGEKEESSVMWTGLIIGGGWERVVWEKRKVCGWVKRGRRWWLRVTTVVESPASNGCDVEDGQTEMVVASNGRIARV